MEIERKFWIQSLPDLPEENCSAVDQGYLCTEPVELRIRRRKEQKTGLTSYQLCIKKHRSAEPPRSGDRADAGPVRGAGWNAGATVDPQGIPHLPAGGWPSPGVLYCGPWRFLLCRSGVCVGGGGASLASLDCLGKETTYETGVSMREYWNTRKGQTQ